MQQGRVTVEADWNEEEQIVNEELRKDLLDIVGSCCTPNDGYRVIETDNSSDPPFDFSVGKGTLYVGGMRVVLPNPLQYSQQTEWFDHLHDPDWVDLPTLQTYPRHELIYLYLREQEVSAVEDTALREVALGGPDTAQRMRLVQHIVRKSTEAKDCAGALAEARKRWATQGLHFDEQTTRLKSLATLQVSFLEEKKKLDPCEPQAHGGYLGADNQLIRVQIAGFNTQTQKYSLVWGFDNASFLYRVNVAADNKTLKLLSRPIDDFHKPRANQAVEVLRSAVQLSAITNDYIASATGSVFKLETDYVSETQSITLPEALAPEYGDINQTPVLFLRVWEEQHDFVAGETIDLGVTGLQVTLQTAGNGPFHIGDYWLLAVRPSTSIDPNASTQIFPHRYLEGPQPPDGPRVWACSLAVIEWNLQILFDVQTILNAAGPIGLTQDQLILLKQMLDASGKSFWNLSEAIALVQSVGATSDQIQKLSDSLASLGKERGPRLALTVIEDCRKTFPPLTPPALHVLATNWVNDEIFSLQEFARGLTITFDAAPETNQPGAVTTISAATMIVTIEIPLYSLMQSTVGTAGPSGPELSLIVTGSVTINANRAQWSVAPDELQRIEALIMPLLRLQQILRVRVTLKGHAIWSMQEKPRLRLYLDGQAFGEPDKRIDGTPRTALHFPTGAGVRASDFESWFYLSGHLETILQVNEVSFTHTGDFGPKTGLMFSRQNPIQQPFQFTSDVDPQTLTVSFSITFNNPLQRASIGIEGRQQNIFIVSANSQSKVVATIQIEGDQQVSITPLPLQIGSYQLIILGTDTDTATAVKAQDGTPLDGDFDNDPGGNFVLPFEVNPPIQ